MTYYFGHLQGGAKEMALSCEKVSARLQPATAGHARLVLSKTLPFFYTSLYTLGRPLIAPHCRMKRSTFSSKETHYQPSSSFDRNQLVSLLKLVSNPHEGPRGQSALLLHHSTHSRRRYNLVRLLFLFNVSSIFILGSSRLYKQCIRSYSIQLKGEE